ncbi:MULTISPECIES: hypothetical protein [unclassified Spirosoma]|uniref:hypothetical protein n=1 Tax=unclassified Spirosoma TaxID=2621999 RepID=UPI000968F7EB|nr:MULTISPECIES: hypothetical protein [unclassified Spirosoma]MBN8826471.1 hypothetical protein [Spirosoma sp.]OJW76436.1 MAG: hypothetical protein BGO59_23265 [Spirosoma sp. 48-14]
MEDFHPTAFIQAHELIELFGPFLPDAWAENPGQYAEDLTLWLAEFDLTVSAKNLTGFDLIKAARNRAKRLYYRDYQRQTDTAIDEMFIRFWLEVALLKTIRADPSICRACNEYYSFLSTITTPINYSLN